MSIAPSIRPSSTWSRGSKSNSGGVADASRAPRSRPRPRPAPRRRRGWGCSSAPRATPPRPRVWAASAALTSAARVLVRASRSCFSSPWACGISLPSCFCSARLASKSAIAARRAESAASGPVHDVVGQSALGLGGAHAVGVVSEHARVDHVARLSGRTSGPHRDSGRAPAPAYCASPYGVDPKGAACSTVPASPSCRWAAVCFAPVRAARARRSTRTGSADPRLRRPWRRRAGVGGRRGLAAATRCGRSSSVFDTIGDDDHDRRSLASLMFVQGHRRAAVFTVGVMVATSLATTGIKLLVGRDRPPWQDPIDAARPPTPSRPGTPRR